MNHGGVFRTHRNTSTKGWSFESASNDCCYARIMRRRTQNVYSVPVEEAHHKADDNELRLARDDRGSLVIINQSEAVAEVSHWQGLEKGERKVHNLEPERYCWVRPLITTSLCLPICPLLYLREVVIRFTNRNFKAFKENYHPPYSTNQPACKFYLFLNLNKYLRANTMSMQPAVNKHFEDKKNYFFINLGEYIEKCHKCVNLGEDHIK